MGSAVARNYAEALFDLAKGSGRVEEYGELVGAVGAAIHASPRLQDILMTPKVTKPAKAKLVGTALERAGAPAEFVRYVEAVVRRGRALGFAAIGDAYAELVDTSLNRARASVTVAREPDQPLRDAIAAALGRVLSKEVIATYTVEPEILGGAIVRVGDRVFDGSIRRRLVRLRRHLVR